MATAGESIYNAVRSLDDECDRLPEAQTWEGKAQKAATRMFRRATDQASPFKNSTDAVASALKQGSTSIGAARKALLNKANEIDQGELHVTDDWVVLVRPAQMSAETAASLQKHAEAEQADINRLLLAVGDADDDAGRNVQAAAKDIGFTPPTTDGLGGLLGAAEPPPVDEIPNPRTMAGIWRQATIRGEDMAITVRESDEATDKDGNRITTLTMQDGSKQIVTVFNRWPPHGNPLPGDWVQVDHYDKYGKFISQTQTQRSENSTETTNIIWSDNTQLVATCTPDGKCTAAFTLPDGRHGVLPPNNPLFTGRVPDILGGGATALESHVGRGGRIPVLTPESVENVGKAARFAGPALGIATTIYNIGASETEHDACVAGISGSFEIAGGYAGGELGAGAGGLGGPLAPVTVPLAAAGGGFLGGKGLGWVGHKVGEVFCPP